LVGTTVSAAEQISLAENALAAGRFMEAAEALRKALSLDHESPRPQLMLAYALWRAGQRAEAIQTLQRLVETLPDNADAWFNLGNFYRAERRLDDAVAAFKRAATMRPDNAEPWINLGYVLAQQGNFAEAERELREAITRHPGEPDLLVNLAQVQRATRRWSDALASLDRCLALSPHHAGYRITRSIALHESGQRDDALAELSALLESAPEIAEAHFARAQMRLLRKDWDGGWEDYLWRPDRLRWLAAQGKRATQRPATRADIAGQDVVLVGEQGLGDVVFFLRFARPVAQVASSVRVEVDPRLEPILPGEWTASPEKGAAPIRILVGDLPAMFRQAPIPSLELAADAGQAAELKARLTSCGPGPYLGLSWQAGVPWKGMASPGAGIFKRVPPADLGQALRSIPGTLISLQRDAVPGDVEALSAAAERPVHDFSWVNESLPDALALLTGLDEYLAVSNTNVHLNEAIGRGTRVLVTHPSEWRWTSDDERSPWFRHARVYRQAPDGSWAAALLALKKELGG
jgi:tetratricopeptide (TPR) repeat protein